MTCVLDRLDVSTRALKRAQYEAFDFRLTDDGVTVRNGSHAAPEEHVYTVTVAGGVPTACTCPADEHHEPACKHRLAVAIREPVLDAAVANATERDADDTDDERDDRDDDERDDDEEGGAPPIPVADGAGVADPPDDEADATESERPDDCACPNGPVEFPCWPCVREGYRALPDDDGDESTDG